MSIESKLDQLIAEFKEDVDELDTTTQSLYSSKSRTAMEFKKNLAIIEKFNLPPEKFQIVFDTIQEIMNICSNYTPPQPLDPPMADLTKVDDGADTQEHNFEKFKETMNERIAQLEKECGKLETLKEFLQQIKTERDLNWILSTSNMFLD